ncbi:hypothetical protein HY498_05285 [Candidatus Woesearchaeota archaeon]|nr:hypothetical protein [Candidatus Woesearchaeota archaeon]
MAISKIRKSGNSIVLVLSPNIIREKHIKVGDIVEYEVFKKIDLSKIFGRGRHVKIDPQKAKDMLREEW